MSPCGRFVVATNSNFLHVSYILVLSAKTCRVIKQIYISGTIQFISVSSDFILVKSHISWQLIHLVDMPAIVAEEIEDDEEYTDREMIQAKKTGFKTMVSTHLKYSHD